MAILFYMYIAWRLADLLKWVSLKYEIPTFSWSSLEGYVITGHGFVDKRAKSDCHVKTVKSIFGSPMYKIHYNT